MDETSTRHLQNDPAIPPAGSSIAIARDAQNGGDGGAVYTAAAAVVMVRNRIVRGRGGGRAPSRRAFPERVHVAP